MLPMDDLDNLLRLAAGGDAGAREKLLEACQPFVFRVASQVSNRPLEWGRDDELSIGLIALNEAVERYRGDLGVPFPAYARLVIRSRLTDYMRRQGREKESCVLVPEDNSGSAGRAEVARAWELHLNYVAARERREEIITYSDMLKQYQITFGDLVKISPRHQDTRQTLLRVARQLARSEVLMARLKDTKRLPQEELMRLTGVGRKVLERGRKYIIAVSLILYHSDELVYLYSYLVH